MAASPIVVGVRVRPFNQREARFQSQCVVGMDAAGTVKLMQMNGGKISTSQAPREFIYDHAFWTHDRASLDDAVLCAPGVVFADQGYVYEKMATPVVENVMSGFNACLFAYGQTGSGKTYSMMGTPSDRGVLPRLGEAMFDKISALKEGGGPSSADKTLCAVEASFCEIYNEKVRDLMVAPAEHHVSTTGATSGAVQPPPAPVNLPIRLDPKKGVFVEGLTKYNITNADDFYVFLENGLSSRAVGSTNMNNTSSRSHAIVILTVSQTGPKGEKSGKLCLVDLAGSERVAATGATGQTATEGQSINLSLTQLGICLKRLAESAEAAAAAAGKKQAASLPIPYRDSALTFLLKENLGGNSRTAMLANISPASVNFDETLATLRFAQIARKVKSVATMNENPQTKLIVQLREELAELKTRFQNLEARKSISAVPTSNTNTPSASMEPPERQSTLPRPSGPSASSSQNITSSASAQRGTTHSGDRLAESAGGDSGVLVLGRKRSTVASHSTTDGAAEVDSLLGSTMNAHIFGARGSGALQSTSSTIAQQLGDDSPTHAGEARAEEDSPDLDKLMQEVVQQRQQQHQQRSVSADSISLTSTDNGDAVDAAEDFDDILSTDNDDEVRPLDALRHTSKSFVFHHRSGSSSHGNGGAAAAPLSTFAALGGRGVSEVTFGNHSIVSNGAGSTSAQQQLLLSSPSFRLNLSRITSSMRHSGGGASSVGGGAGDTHGNTAGGPLSSGSGARHDADLDDMMSHNTSTDVSRRSLGGGGSSQSRFMDAREINSSFTAAALTQGKGLLQQRQSSQGQSFTNSAAAAAGNQNNNVVFLDSRKPQLIHLNPDAVGHTDVPLVMVLEEGENTFDIGGAHVVFVWDALGNQVVLFGTPEAIAVNGERIEDEGTILRHRDRVVILGVLAFRFSFAAGVLALEGGFNKTPTCVAHVVLLEKYYRNTVQLERSRDAMSIAKAYVYQTASLKEALESAEKTPVPRKPQSEAGNDDDDDGRPLGSAARMKAQRQSVNVTRMSRNSVSLGSNSDDSPVEFDDDYSGMSSTPRGTTPRSSDPTLAAIGNDIALFNELIYKLEVELADDYPLPEEALAGVDGDEAEGEQQRVAAESYAEAIAEVERNQQDQERELEWLKAQVLHAGNRLERESTFRGRRDRQHRAMPNMSIASPLDSKRRSLSHCFQSPPSAADRQLDFIDMGEDVAVEHSTGDPTPASMSPLSPSNNGAGGPAAEVTSGAVPGEETEHATANVTTPSKAHQDDDAHVTTEAVVIDEVAETLALDDDDIEFEQGVSDQITTRIVQLELAYHRRVRALQQFSRLGPKNPDDKELWELLYTNPPFLGDSSLQCEQSCYCQVRDHWNGISAWTQRFVSASRSYLFVFKKADGRERCTAAIYLPGATLAKLNDTDVEVCPACPRHAKDTKTGNPKDASLVLRFRDAAEHDLWQEWFRVQVCPIPVPHHMLKRQVEERATLLASSATTFDLYGDEVSTAQGSPSSPPQAGGKSRRMSVAIVASGGAAVQHVDQLSGTANWKPDQSSNSCEKCTKNFTFFKRRHHCRGCGGIFCADCVQKCVPFGNQLACQTCREERLASPGSFKTLSPRNQRKASKKQLRSTTTLTTGNQAAVALDTYAAIVPSDEEIYLLDALVEDFAVYIDHDPNLIRVRVDHFQGRFHTILADDLVSVARCPLNGCRLNIRCKNIQGAPALAPGGGLSASTALLSTPSSYSIGAGITPAATTVTSRSIYFQDSTTRERCFESLWVLLANQVFIDGLDGARLSSTFAHADLVVQDESEFSLLRTTSRASSDISVWAGIESTRAIPFHHGYGLYAILGFQESWSERQLEHYQLHLVSTLRLGRKKPSLYIVAHQSLRHVLQGPAVTAPVTKVTAASISGADVVVSAVGIRVFETSLVFIASNFFEYSSAVCGGGASGDAPQVIPSASTSTDGKRPSYFDPSVAMAASTSVCLNGGRDETIFDEYAAASEFSLQDLQMGGDSSASEPQVDLLQWYDHAFLLGAPDMENIGFQRKTISDSSLVQVRTTVGASASMKKSGRTWSQFLVPALNVHAAKFSFNVPSAAVARNNNINNGGDSAERQYQRPLITVRSATFMCDDGSHAKDVTSQCELWGQQLGFDRYDHAAQRIVHDPRGSFLRKQKMKSSSTATTTPPAVDPPHQPGEREEAAVTPPPPDGSLLDIKDDNNNSNGFLRTVVLANTLADYLIAKCLRLTIPGVASCVVHMAAIPEGTTTVMTLEGTWGGGVVGLVKATIEYRMVSV